MDSETGKGACQGAKNASLVDGNIGKDPLWGRIASRWRSFTAFGFLLHAAKPHLSDHEIAKMNQRGNP
jgi:hypothetical protein